MPIAFNVGSFLVLKNVKDLRIELMEVRISPLVVEGKSNRLVQLHSGLSL